MRIALFTDTYLPQVNGVSRTLARLVQQAGARGHRLALVTPRIPGAQKAQDASLHLQLSSLPLPFYPEHRIALAMDRADAHRLDAFAPDLVHVATEFGTGWAGVRWAQDRGVPLVTSFHTNFPAYLSGYGFGGLERPLWRYLRAFHGRSVLTFCPSHATLSELRRHGFQGRIRIWSRGVDAGVFRPDRRRHEVRQRLAPGAKHILLYVGRLAPEKRLDVLLEAFGTIRRCTGDDVALVVVGDGPAADELRAQAPDGVYFTGYLSGVALAEAYAAGDVFVFPSDTETFGNVVLEAMASGLPVVAPARGGVTDTVRPDETGLLVPPRDADALAEATLSLLRDDVRRNELAAGARSEALRRNWERIFDRLFEAYAEATGRRREQAAA